MATTPVPENVLNPKECWDVESIHDERTQLAMEGRRALVRVQLADGESQEENLGFNPDEPDQMRRRKIMVRMLETGRGEFFGHTDYKNALEHGIPGLAGGVRRTPALAATVKKLDADLLASRDHFFAQQAEAVTKWSREEGPLYVLLAGALLAGHPLEFRLASLVGMYVEPDEQDRPRPGLIVAGRSGLPGRLPQDHQQRGLFVYGS